jgi:RNA polymerase sigma factor (sigma-70 family)
VSIRDQLIVDNLPLARYHASRRWCISISPAVSFDDLYQAACVGLCKAADTWIDGSGPFNLWATIKIRAEIIDELRRMRCRFRRGHGIEPELEIVWEPLGDVEEGPHEPHINLAEQIEHLLSRLSPRTREMIRLYYGLHDDDEWPVRRIAAEFGCSHTTVENRVKQAIELIRTSELECS